MKKIEVLQVATALMLYAESTTGARIVEDALGPDINPEKRLESMDLISRRGIAFFYSLLSIDNRWKMLRAILHRNGLSVQEDKPKRS